jgi:ABC-type uncharacterized transport system permease subunit
MDTWGGSCSGFLLELPLFPDFFPDLLLLFPFPLMVGRLVCLLNAALYRKKMK